MGAGGRVTRWRGIADASAPTVFWPSPGYFYLPL